MADQKELTISDIHGSVTRDSPDVYITFRVGDQNAETPVIKNASERIAWSEPVTVPANHGGRGSRAKPADLLVVRAYDKKPLLPDALLGEATVELSSLSLGDSHVAGSGGGANVQVQLLGKLDKFGGALTFTLTSTEGQHVPGGTTWGPQEVHDGKGASAAGVPLAAGTPRTFGSNVGDHASTGFTGGGATAFPAQEKGKDLHGEHLADFEKGPAGHAGTHGTTGFGGGGATAFPAQESGKDLHGEHLSDFDKGAAGAGAGKTQQGGGIIASVKNVLGYETPAEQQQTMPASDTTAGTQSGGIIGSAKQALGYGTPSEQRQTTTASGATDNTKSGGGIIGTAKQVLGYGTPSEQQQTTTTPGTQSGGIIGTAKQALGYCTPSEQQQTTATPGTSAGTQSGGVIGSAKQALGYGTPSEQQQTTATPGTSAGTQSGGIIGSAKQALGYGTPAEHQHTTTASGTTDGTQSGGYLESAKQAVGLGAKPAATEGHRTSVTPGTTAGTQSGGVGYLESAKQAVGFGATPATDEGHTTTTPRSTVGTQSGGVLDSAKQAVGLGGDAAATQEQQTTATPGTTAGTQSGGPGYIEPVEQVAGLGATPASTEGQQAVGSTAGVTGGGAEARPAEAAGVEFGGLHLSDYDKQGGLATGAGTDVATANTAAMLGGVGSGQGAYAAQPSADPAAASNAGLGAGTASRPAGLTSPGTAAGGATGTTSRSGLPSTGTAVDGSTGTTGKLRQVGVADCADGSGQTAHLHMHKEPVSGLAGVGGTGSGGAGGSEFATGAGQPAISGVGGGAGAEGATKEQLFLATGIAGATKEVGHDSGVADGGSSAGGHGLAASSAPTTGAGTASRSSTSRGSAGPTGTAATGAAATGSNMGGHTGSQAGGHSDGVLCISGIGGKFARHSDTLGHVTPYFVFEVGKERATTATHKKVIKTLEALTWDDSLELELPRGGGQELHVIAYNKKHLLPDSRLGEARAPLDQLPRGRQAKLNLIDHRTLGNLAGDVEFTLTGGGAGGEGAGNDSGMVEGAVGLSTTEHQGVASGALKSYEERRSDLAAQREDEQAQAKAAKGK